MCYLSLLQPYINRLGLLYSENRIVDFKQSVKIIVYILLFRIHCLTGATLIGVPVLNVVYNVDLQNIQAVLQLIIIGATLIAIVTVLSTALNNICNTKI